MKELIISELRETLKGTLSPRAVQDRLMNCHESDIAQALEVLTKDERARLYVLLTPDRLAEVLSYTEERDRFIGELGINARLALLDHLDTPEVTEYLRGLSQRDR